jgi:uncharacterized membrane protein
MLSISLKRILTIIAILLLVVIGGRFFLRDVPHYFIFTEKSYTPYFWTRNVGLFTHIFFGMTAFLLGPFQFISQIRKNYVKAHRTMGKVYLVCIAVAAPAGIYMAITSQVNFVYAAGLFSLALVWLATSLVAYISIRKGLTSIHREWMVRSYVVTFAFATFRLFDDLLGSWGVGPGDLRASLLSWSCWSLPLFATEVILQVRKFNKLRLATRKKASSQLTTFVEN